MNGSWEKERFAEIFNEEQFKKLGKEFDYVFQALYFMGKASTEMSKANTVIVAEGKVSKKTKDSMKMINQAIHELQRELRESMDSTK